MTVICELLPLMMIELSVSVRGPVMVAASPVPPMATTAALIMTMLPTTLSWLLVLVKPIRPRGLR